MIYPRSQYLGPAGNATKTKLAINHILGLNRVALAEGLVFAETMGLDLPSFLAAARQSAAYSQIMDVKGDKMIAGDFEPVGKLSQHLKDIRTMLRRGRAARAGTAVPLAARARWWKPASGTARAGATTPSPSRKSAAARRPANGKKKTGAAGGQ